MKYRNIIIIGIIVISLISLQVFAGLEAVDELQQKAISIMLAEHPALLSQQRIIDIMQGISLPERGFISSMELTAGLGTEVDEDNLVVIPKAGLDLTIPLFSARDILEQSKEELAMVRGLETDIQRLVEMKEELIGRLVEEIDALIQLQHSFNGRQRLLNVLGKHRKQLQEMIQAGISTQESLWELEERIAGLGIEIRDIEAGKILEINRIALNYGGDRWQELKDVLKEIIEAVGVDENGE
jgi:hypothetical protein